MYSNVNIIEISTKTIWKEHNSSLGTFWCIVVFVKLLSCKFESRSWWDVFITTLCDQVCQWLATGQWFSTGTSVSSTNKTDLHDITEILLKVVLNTLTLTINYWVSLRNFLSKYNMCKRNYLQKLNDQLNLYFYRQQVKQQRIYLVQIHTYHH